MQIEFNNTCSFDLLNPGDFFFDMDGSLYLKISEEKENNAVSISAMTRGNHSLFSFGEREKCRLCQGKIVIS